MHSQAQPSIKIPASEVAIPERLAFLKKVYGLLGLSLATAAIASWMTVSNEGFLTTVYENYIAFIVVEVVALIFCMVARKNESLSFIALFSFTILTGVTTAPLLVMYGGEAVTQALTLTAIAFVGLSLYALLSKKDFSFLRGAVTVGLIVLILGGLLNAFVFRSSGFEMMISFAGVFIFCGFILYDTSNILKRYPTDEYISATLALYLDILNLFLFLLRIFGGGRD